MNYALIKENDIANGPGIRTSLFVSGCRHHCKGCFNPETWNFDYGRSFTQTEIDHIINVSEPSYVDGLSLLGGEPFEPENRAALIDLLKQFKQILPHKTIWCYTGFDFEKDLIPKIKQREKDVQELLELIDVVVDGKFIETLKSPVLLFRGSANQRIIDVHSSLQEGCVMSPPGQWARTLGNLNINEM